jgi:uncharacterized DUF497 family protein
LKQKQAIQFSWNVGNRNKNWTKHQVTDSECEEVFFDAHKKEYLDQTHSREEPRKLLVGQTKRGRVLFIVYTIRNNAIRVISARDLNRREGKLYEKEN